MRLRANLPKSTRRLQWPSQFPRTQVEAITALLRAHHLLYPPLKQFSSTMTSSSDPSQRVDPSSTFKSMLDAALVEYKKKTGEDLQALWLASELQTCESVDSILDVLRHQAKAFERSSDDQKLIKWIDPLVNVLFTFSDTLGGGVSLVSITNPVREDLNIILAFFLKAFPPAKVIFTGISALLGVRILTLPSRGRPSSYAGII
jgi:hypothetical protein